MKTFVISVIAIGLTGCCTAKIDKAYDEGFAKGSEQSMVACSKAYQSDMESLGTVNEQLRRRLDDCHASDLNK